MPALLASAALVLALHGLALSGLRWVWPHVQAPPAPHVAVQVRPVAEARRSEAPTPAPERVPPAEAGAAPARPVRPHPVAALPPAPVVMPAVVAPVAAPVRAAATEPAATRDDDTEALPIYPTRIPPATTLRYRLQRGSAVGRGELTWQPDGDRYALHFESRVDGAVALNQLSEGGFDEAGVAPLRFVDQRLRRAAAAANFQREAGRITFSGKAAAAPLRPGSQDRLSWMLQLAAIVAADPALRRDGARVRLQVASAAGDVAVWIFHCEAAGVVEPGSGVADTLAFVREPRGPYDTRAAVWLDPARSYLPVRAVWKSGPADDGFDLQLDASP